MYDFVNVYYIYTILLLMVFHFKGEFVDNVKTKQTNIPLENSRK